MSFAELSEVEAPLSTAGDSPGMTNRSPFVLVGTTAADLAGAADSDSKQGKRPGSKQQVRQRSVDAATILPTTTWLQSTEAVAGTAWEREWKGVLRRLERPSARMLLHQHANLFGVERTENGLVATVAVVPNWLDLVAMRREALEAAFEIWYGQPVRVALVVEVEG